MSSTDFKNENENIVEVIVQNLIQELKEKLECNLDGKRNQTVVKNSYSDISIVNDQIKRLMDESPIDDLSSSSSISSSEEENELRVSKQIETSSDTDENEFCINRKQRKMTYTKTKDEVTPDEMPAPECIDFKLDEQAKLIKLGRVFSRVNKLIVVQSTDCVPMPLDENTILFDANRKSIGKIYETFGPVATPFYSIRFASIDEIENRQLALNVGAYVLYAPEKSEFTKFIFNIDEMRCEKGSDASWLHDNEPPPEYFDYSDDEKERAAKKVLTKKNNTKIDKKNDKDDASSDDSDNGEVSTLKRSALYMQDLVNSNKKKTNFFDKKKQQQSDFSQRKNAQRIEYSRQQGNWQQQNQQQRHFLSKFPSSTNPNLNQRPHDTNLINSILNKHQTIPLPLMQVGLAASNLGFNNYQPFSMFNCKPYADLRNNHIYQQLQTSTVFITPSEISANQLSNQSSQIVDKRYIQDKEYVKKKF